MADSNTPAGRIGAAIKGLPAGAVPLVRGTDVIAVADALPEGKRTETTKALRDGAAGAIGWLPPEKRAVEEVRQPAGALAQLLEAAGDGHPE